MSRIKYQPWKCCKALNEAGNMTEEAVLAAISYTQDQIVMYLLNGKFYLDVIDKGFDRGDAIYISYKIGDALLRNGKVIKFEVTFFGKYNFVFCIPTTDVDSYPQCINEWMNDIKETYLKTAAENQANIKTELYQILNHLNAVYVVSECSHDLEIARMVIKRLIDWQTRIKP